MHLARRLGRRLPRPLRTAGVLTLYALEVLGRARGTHPKECTCCGFSGRFAIYGHPPRYDARCPQCGSNERQRLIALAVERAQLVRAGKKVLYFTPEVVLSEYLGARRVDFESVGLKNPDFIEAQDGAFDLVIASNVLEHARNDLQALSELRRVLNRHGRIIITVPLIGGWDNTYEDQDILSEDDRKLHFGEKNHIRYYGRDIKDRIVSAGFLVEEHVVSGQESVRYGLIRGDRVFVASIAPAVMALPSGMQAEALSG
jgi:SAM-dependent methyltransferase